MRILILSLFVLAATAQKCEENLSQEKCTGDCEWTDGECQDTLKRTLGYFQHNIPTFSAPPPPHQIPQQIPHGAGIHQPHPSSVDGNTCRMFPYTCRPGKYDIKSLEPPVNIPYCQRIPCPVADEGLRQKTQNNMAACMSQPGCFFDKELSYYRRAFHNSVLPDVPVCHLVIRNHVFLEHARKYAAKYNSWNPLLTNCLLETYHDEIYGDTAGCYMANVLEYFGYRPRIAGWRGISPTECHAIDGCWRPGKGCAYPVEGQAAAEKFQPHSAQSSPEQPRTISTDPYEVYNRVPCHRFDNMYSADKFLDTYHQCLSSGCLLDPSVNRFYTSHLYNMSQALPTYIQGPFWQGVRANRIRADNYRLEVYRLRTMYANRAKYGYTHYRNPFSVYQQMPSYYPTHTQYPYGYGRTLNTENDNESDRTIPSNYNFGSQAHNQQHGYGQQYGQYGYGQSGYGYGYQQYNPYYNLRCPYQPIKYDNFPELKGSFKGCCDRSLCYSPPGNVHTSVLSSYYSHWAPWGSCNVTCGGGVRSRMRYCIGTLSTQCADDTQEEPCNMHQCPVWGDWSDYSACSATCGNRGTKTRSRACTQGQCVGPKTEQIPCSSDVPCPSVAAPPARPPTYYGQQFQGYYQQQQPYYRPAPAAQGGGIYQGQYGHYGKK